MFVGGGNGVLVGGATVGGIAVGGIEVLVGGAIVFVGGCTVFVGGNAVGVGGILSESEIPSSEPDTHLIVLSATHACKASVSVSNQSSPSSTPSYLAITVSS